MRTSETMKIYLVVFFIFNFFSLEAHVSEVFYQDSGESLEKITARAQRIVIVSGNDPKEEVYKKVIFPKETHHNKKEATTYSEYTKIYEVKKVLKGDVASDAVVRVWVMPDYDEGATRIYHETGQTESPLHSRYTSKNSPKEKESKILFLNNKYDGNNNIYIFIGEEGIESLEKVQMAIKSNKL